MVPYNGKIHLVALVQFGGGYFETMSLCGSGLEKLSPPRTIRRAGNPCGKRRDLHVQHHMRGALGYREAVYSYPSINLFWRGQSGERT